MSEELKVCNTCKFENGMPIPGKPCFACVKINKSKPNTHLNWVDKNENMWLKYERKGSA